MELQLILAISKDNLRPLPPFSFEGNLSYGWKAVLNFFLTATESDAKSNKIKASILLTCIGLTGREIYETFVLWKTEAQTSARKIYLALQSLQKYHYTSLSTIYLQAKRRSVI